MTTTKQMQSTQMNTLRANITLGVVAAFLCIISVLLYQASVRRAERFERGQPFLPNLNPDEIVSIEVTKGEDRAALKRDDDHFVVTTENGYPAKNEAVNRLLRSVIDIDLEKRIGIGDDLATELGVAPDAEGATEVVLSGEGGQTMVHFVVSEPRTDGTGSYVRRLDSDERPIFLTSAGVSLNAQGSTFLDKEILDVKASEIAAIRGADLLLEADDNGELQLQGVPGSSEPKPSAMNKIKGVLSFLSFDEVYLADDPMVRDLQFTQRLEVELEDGSGYRLSLAEKGDDVYLRVEGFHTVTSLSVDRDEGEEQLKEKAEIMSRANEIQRFNAIHGSWVYKINDVTADKIRMRKSDLMQRRS